MQILSRNLKFNLQLLLARTIGKEIEMGGEEMKKKDGQDKMS